MDKFDLEIKRIVEFYNSSLSLSEQKSELEIDCIIKRIKNDYELEKYDFANFKTLKLKQNGKTRIAKQYEAWSTELFLCIYLKRCIDRLFKVKYPNRNNDMKLMFSTISSIQNMKDFVIVRFDFEDFFNSISSEYVYNKCILSSSLGRVHKDLLKKFTSSCPYCYAGINTSNVLAEILSSEFDNLVYNIFATNGLIFYKRYVDDGVLIFNRYISKDECVEMLNTAIDKIFYNKFVNTLHKCHTKLNMQEGKFSYVSKRILDLNPNSVYKIHFLGYQFSLRKSDKRIDVIYGLTNSKIEKYTKKINKIIDDYAQNADIELLRHRLKAFTCRTVYRRKHYNTRIWIVKGFISNYNELRYHLDKIDAETQMFLQKGVLLSFENRGIQIPYFLIDDSERSPYSLYYNLKRNRSLLFEENERIGINKNTLKDMCRKVGISVNEKSYNYLLREYLIKIKVGH